MTIANAIRDIRDLETEANEAASLIDALLNELDLIDALLTESDHFGSETRRLITLKARAREHVAAAIKRKNVEAGL